MLWEIYQQRQIWGAQQAASRAEGKAGTADRRLRSIEDKIDSLALVCQAMWELLSESLPDADARIDEKLREIDLRDGKLDGKMNRVERTCSQCDRPLHKRHLRCLYCGHEMTSENLFQR